MSQSIGRKPEHLSQSKFKDLNFLFNIQIMNCMFYNWIVNLLYLNYLQVDRPMFLFRKV